ncbi:MAG TPA: NUDIX hydrolase [Deltaproteobacteria bacterium]|nr:NUDIX hydrolase [Deltaproteobacteria bacterium]HQI81365.1 NUDIX hydrolase [Deltaproteobacteria bacterium]
MGPHQAITCPNCGHGLSIYRNPVPTVDIIIGYEGGIVLVLRKNPPPGWALPGGFVDYGETVEAAAIREAREETGLDLAELRQFGVYSDPGRDPRQHTITTVFTAKGAGVMKAGDDAARVQVFGLEALPELAFDHARILGDYGRSIRKGG